MPDLNANIRAFNLCAESLKLYSSYFIALICICIWFVPEEWKHCPKLPQLFSFNFYYAHIPPAISYWLLSRGGKERELWLPQFLSSKSPFLGFWQTWWERRKVMRRLLHHLTFLDLAFFIQSKFCSEEVWFLELSTLLPTWSSTYSSTLQV